MLDTCGCFSFLRFVSGFFRPTYLDNDCLNQLQFEKLFMRVDEVGYIVCASWITRVQ